MIALVDDGFVMAVHGFGNFTVAGRRVGDGNMQSQRVLRRGV